MIRFSIPIFLHFRNVHNRSFLDILPNFNLLWALEQIYMFWTFISENLWPLLISCSKSWWGIGENDVNFSKNNTRVEIIITTSTAIRIKNNINCGSNIPGISYVNSYYSLSPCGIFEKMTLLPPKTETFDVRNRLKCGKISKKDRLFTKYKKVDI